MNVNPFIFEINFNDVYDTLEEFLKLIIEIIYSPIIQIRTGSNSCLISNQEIPKSNLSNANMNNQFILIQSESSSEESFEEKFYLYDNFSFVSDVIIELIRLNKDNYETLDGDFVLISRKLFRKITINNSEYLATFIHCISYVYDRYRYQARGKDIFVFYKDVFFFLNIRSNFYKLPKFEIKTKVSDKIVYGFDEFIVTHELTNSVLEDIYNSAKIFSDNIISYFETERINKIFIENAQRIIKFSSKNEITSISTTNYVSVKCK